MRQAALDTVLDGASPDSSRRGCRVPGALSNLGALLIIAVLVVSIVLRVSSHEATSPA